jgi:two-component system, NarL family, nitrate/nitrite response regulator NarL
MSATLVDHDECTSSATATVLIVEDHALLADGLSVALERAGVQAEVATGPTADDIVAAAHRCQPDVVLLDLMLGDDIGCSIPLIAEFRSTGAEVLVLTGVTDCALLGSCLEAGALGLVSKTEAFDTVLEKVVRASRRQTTMHESERHEMLGTLRRLRAEERRRRAPFDRLTARERIVLGALMHGSSAEDIASSSFVSIATIRSQIRSILVKLGVHSQIAAVALAHRAHWEP